MDSKEDDMIDLRKLETELVNAIAKDEKYQRENDAKFRAIRQKVGSYDEFRDIVLASHLKPLDKKDISGGMPYQAWNKMASNGTRLSQSGPNGGESSTTEVRWTIPETSAEFDKIWKRFCKTPKDRYDFLLSIGPENLKNIFIMDAPLGEIVASIKIQAVFSDDLENILYILKIISNSKRFSLMLDFLDEHEKADLNDVFSACKNMIERDDENKMKKFESLSENYRFVFE